MKKGWQILIGLLTGVVFIFSCRQAEPEKEVKTLKPDSTKMTELPPPGAPAVVPSREDLQKQISDQEKSIDPNKEIDLNENTFQNLFNLKYLSINKCNLKDNGVRSLFKNGFGVYSRQSKLDYLSLSWNNLTKLSFSSFCLLICVNCFLRVSFVS